MELLQMVGISFGITAGSRLAEWIWKKNRADVETKLNALDELIEAKTGYQWPVELHLLYDQAVKKIVASCDYVANPVVFRRIERALLQLADPAKRGVLLSEWFEVLKAKTEAAASEELKKIINAEKETAAVEAVGAQASIQMPPQFLASRDIKADVKAAVVAIKHDDPKEIAGDDLNSRIAATRARLEALVKSHG